MVGEDVKSRSPMLVRPTVGQVFGRVGGVNIVDEGGNDVSDGVRAGMSDAEFGALKAKLNYKFERGILRGPWDQDVVALRAAFSLATDLGLGQPTEHVLRSWLIASRMADRLDISEDMRPALYYVMTLAWVGCVADTPEVATWFGDDIAYRRDSYAVDLAGLPLLDF